MNRDFFSHVREPIVPSRTLNVLFWRIVDSGYPDYPSSFSNDPLSPSTWRTMSPEIGNRTIHTRTPHPFLDPKWSRTPGSKTRAGCGGRSVAALKSCVKLFRSWYPHLPAITIPFLFLVLSSSPARYFFLFSPSYRFHPSREELGERMTRMRHFFFEITWGEKRWINDGCNLYRWKLFIVV